MIERVTLNIDFVEWLRLFHMLTGDFAWGKANLQSSWIKSANSTRLAAKQFVGPNEYFTSFATLFAMNKNT